jgi:NAD(P)-dependent dehydrogenase (short-subunit alcohol dehydrogenase family)
VTCVVEMKSTAIVIGGAGALGKAVVKELSKASLATISIDFHPNQEAGNNLIIDKNSTLGAQYKDVRTQLDRYLTQAGNNGSVKGVFCAAGGWMGGTIGDENFLQVLHQMNSMNLETAALASNFAVNYLEKDGTLILTGAQAALHPCVGMMGYGVSKSATHYLVSSIVQDEVFTQKSCRAYGILPAMIDTPSNRAGMPNSNFLSWTKVSCQILSLHLFSLPRIRSPRRSLGNVLA